MRMPVKRTKPLIYAIFALMTGNASANTATLQDLHWMVGAWAGSLGPQHVAEAWSEPHAGSMSTMVRLTTDTDVAMIELIAIREEGETLVLHLRQFSPALETRLSQDMPLAGITPDSVSFSGPADSTIKGLAYRRVDDNQMAVDVTIADGVVVTASLQRR